MSYNINLTDRGPSVISSIDLFDECQYGADKLFFRGKFGAPGDILTQIKIALGDISLLDKEQFSGKSEDEIKTELGIGNPLEVEKSQTAEVTVPTIALNRYHIKGKKFWENVVPTDIANPYKASAAVSFGLRVIFKEDSAFIKFGAPWCTYMNEETDMNADGSSVSINDFVLFAQRNISKEDSLLILESILEGVKVRENTTAMNTTVHVINVVDENGEYLAI